MIGRQVFIAVSISTLDKLHRIEAFYRQGFQSELIERSLDKLLEQEELTTSPIVRAFSVIEERVGLDYGYLRVRAELVNSDFLELAEYFVVHNDAVEVKRYRPARQLWPI